MTPDMNNRPESPSVKLPEWLTAVPVRLFKIFAHNWGWKLLALFLALCLWAGLITQDPTLTRERVFTDVPLSVTGSDTLRRNGLIVVSGLEEGEMNVRLRVDVPQREYNTVVYSNFNPRIELARVTKAGEQQVKVATTSSSVYGSVEDVSPAYLTIVVDEYITNYRVPVSINQTGEYPEGFYGGTFSLDPSLVSVSGPKSVVDKVARIYVDYDASALTPEAGTLLTAMPMRFIDRNGQEVVSDQLEATVSGVVLRTINVKQTLYPVREMPISQADLIIGEPAHGYRVTDVTISPTVIRAAGEEEMLDDLGVIFTENPISVSGASESFRASVRLRKPAELEHLSTSTVQLAITIEPVITSTTLPSVRLSVHGTGSGLRVARDANAVSAVVTGPQTLVESLRAAQVSAYVDITGLTAGVYELPVQFIAEGADMEALTFEATPSTVTVTITNN